MKNRALALLNEALTPEAIQRSVADLASRMRAGHPDLVDQLARDARDLSLRRRFIHEGRLRLPETRAGQ